MKKIFVFLFAAIFALSGCQNGIDELVERVDDLEGRVTVLEQLCGDMNANIKTIQAFVAATEGNLFIEKVTEVADGFTITFTNGKTYTLKNGEKGNKGDKGEQGEQGEQGATAVPNVGIAYSPEDGYYWTIDGNPAVVDGKKVSALGVTPQLRINEGKWEVSYNEGTTWEEIAPAYDQSNQITITEDENAVYLTLGDGTKFTISKVPGFAFKVAKCDVLVSAGVVELPYTLTDGDESVRFEVRGTYEAKVIPTDNTKGVIAVTVPDPVVEGYVIVTAVKNSTSEFKAQYISFEEAVLNVSDEAFDVKKAGGLFEVTIQTNLDYEVKIPTEAQSWISVVESRAVRTDVVAFQLAENNTGEVRTATVTIEGEGFTKSIAFVQSNSDLPPIYLQVENASPINVAATATTATINIKANVAWTVTVPEGVTAAPAAGEGDAKVVLTFESNQAAGVYESTEFEAVVATENTEVVTPSYTIKVVKAAAKNPNEFTYVRWGNNLDLTPAADYLDQFRVTKEMGTLTVPVAESDIVEGAAVKYAIELKTHMSKQPFVATIDENTGAITITWQEPNATNVLTARAHCAYVTVTVGEGEGAMVKKFPVFVHYQGVSNGYDIRMTPFAYRFNPKTGGTQTPKSVEAFDADGNPINGLTIDYRRDIGWFNFRSEFTEGNLSKETSKYNHETSLLVPIWTSYYGDKYDPEKSLGACNPISWWANKTEEKLANAACYVTPETFAITVNPEKFVKNGVYGDGLLMVTMAACKDGLDPLVKENSPQTVRPLILFFDSSLVE